MNYIERIKVQPGNKTRWHDREKKSISNNLKTCALFNVPNRRFAISSGLRLKL